MRMKLENRLSNEEIKARLILVVGVCLSSAFLFSIVAAISIGTKIKIAKAEK